MALSELKRDLLYFLHVWNILYTFYANLYVALIYFNNIIKLLFTFYSTN